MSVHHDRNNYKVTELKKVNELNLFWLEVNEIKQMETGTLPKRHPQKWCPIHVNILIWPILVSVLLKMIGTAFYYFLILILGKVPPFLHSNVSDLPSLHSLFAYIVPVALTTERLFPLTVGFEKAVMVSFNLCPAATRQAFMWCSMNLLVN